MIKIWVTILILYISFVVLNVVVAKWANQTITPTTRTIIDHYESASVVPETVVRLVQSNYEQNRLVASDSDSIDPETVATEEAIDSKSLCDHDLVATCGNDTKSCFYLDSKCNGVSDCPNGFDESVEMCGKSLFGAFLKFLLLNLSNRSKSNQNPLLLYISMQWLSTIPPSVQLIATGQSRGLLQKLKFIINFD